MRNIILLICSFFVFNQISLAQNDDAGNIAYPNNFNVNPQTSNKISITNASQSLVVTGSFGITVADLFKNDFTELKTNLAVIENGNVVFEVAGPDFKKPADFPNSQTLSAIKNFSITIPQAIISNIITTYPNAQLILRYKFNYNSSSGILPNVPTGWLPQVAFSREYFVHNTKYGFIDDRPRAKITGPDEINTEGTYQVDGAASFQEVPTSNVYNAILNHLGSGKYIITANPGFIGSITLLAKHSNGLETYKVVQVKGPPLNIQGPSSICSEETYVITGAQTVILENATGIATLTDLGNGQWKVTKIGNGNVILKATNGNKIVEKRILIGAATIVGDIISGNSAITPPNSGYSIYDYEISTDAVNQIEWVSSGWSNVIVQFNGNRASLSVPANNTSTNKTVQLKVRVLNACGNSDYVYKNITIYKSGGGSGGPDPEGPIQ